MFIAITIYLWTRIKPPLEGKDGELTAVFIFIASMVCAGLQDLALITFLF